MGRKTPLATLPRITALCYIRQSKTRDANDMDSPERQRSNIQIICEQQGWTPEWYMDADGHKTGTKEKNRPGWLAVKARLGDPDVVALVANDLSRLHRKGWRIGDLLDFVDEYGVKLVLAAPGKQMDFSTPQGRIVAQVGALFDEWYAIDISQRSRDMIAHRKRDGKTVGLPPFGTVRGQDGYLKPSPLGAWLLPDGTFCSGTADASPDAGAMWRSYYKAAERVLQIYSEDKHGFPTIAYQIQMEGWAYRRRDGEPTVFGAEDVRRIVSNWGEYGGYVWKHRARERHPHDHNPADVHLIAERAVFPLDLLYRVGQVRYNRAVGHRSVRHGIKAADYPYALNGIIYCAHCEGNAVKHNDGGLRSRLAGMWHDRNPRYRHKSGVKCGCTNRSVMASILEAEFARLLKLLVVRDDQIEALNQLSLRAAQMSPMGSEVELEAEKRTALARLQRQQEANRHLFEDGDLTREEYLRRREKYEQEKAHWEARTSESEKLALELTLCVEAVHRLSSLWEVSTDEDRQGMARNLFNYVIFDLDTHRIVDFRLKPWADRFVTLRAALYEEVKGLERTIMFSQGQYTEVALTGFDPIKVSTTSRFRLPSSGCCRRSMLKPQSIQGWQSPIEMPRSSGGMPAGRA